MLGRAIFITGTGTGVGKTHVTGLLLRALRLRGCNAVTMKPVQTGATREGRGWRVPDLEEHWRLAGEKMPEDATVFAPYCYAPAVSPHLAGRLAGEPVSLEHLAGRAESLRGTYDAVLIEGAGGLLVPLNEQETTLDFVRLLGIPLLVVAHAGLGTINHTLLTVAAARAAHVEVAGVVLNDWPAEPEQAILADNPTIIERLGNVKIWKLDRLDALVRELSAVGTLSRETGAT